MPDESSAAQDHFDVPPRPTTDAEIAALPVLDLDEIKSSAAHAIGIAEPHFP